MADVNTTPKVTKTEEEWRRSLTPEQFHVLRQHGTERAFTGPYWNDKRAGTYVCAGCGSALFTADTKYDSGTGWPSFWQPIAPDAVTEKEDRSWFMRRTEICCATCGGHLGHVFEDGPRPTGRRYCMNGTAMKLQLASNGETV